MIQLKAGLQGFVEELVAQLQKVVTVAGVALSSLGISLTHMLTQSFLNRALIASGALWCVVGISAGLTRGNQNNAQLTCAESAKRHRSPRTLIASLRPVSAGAS